MRVAGVIVIVGAGLAGVRTAEGLRDRGFDGEIIVLSEETHLPYDRPPLSKQVLRGEREPVYLRREEDYRELRLDLRRDTCVTALDTTAKRVLTAAGPIEYDEVVLATGARPRRLPGSPGHVLRTLDDCRTLAAILQSGARIVIAGAGLIGCEVAASARARDVEVHLVDVLTHPLLRVLGAQVAQRITELHEGHGVQFHLGGGVSAATATSVTLDDGTVLEADAVLEAVGVVPATDWLRSSGLDLADGVGCNEVGQAAEGVWAVGDVARWSDGSGSSRRTEHWTAAADQAEVVAAALLGTPPPPPTVPYWWSDQYDLRLQGLGLPGPNDDVQVQEVGPRGRPLALYSRAGRLTGVVGFSAAAYVTALRSAVREASALEEVVASLPA